MDSALAGSSAASSCPASALQCACTSCRSSFLSRRFSRRPAACAAAWTIRLQSLGRVARMQLADKHELDSKTAPVMQMVRAYKRLCTAGHYARLP